MPMTEYGSTKLFIQPGHRSSNSEEGFETFWSSRSSAIDGIKCVLVWTFLQTFVILHSDHLGNPITSAGPTIVVFFMLNILIKMQLKIFEWKVTTIWGCIHVRWWDSAQFSSIILWYYVQWMIGGQWFISSWILIYYLTILDYTS